jgi:Carboxylesterase family
MRFSRLFRGRSRVLGLALVVAGVIVVVIALASAGPAEKPASAQVTSCAPGTTVKTTAGSVCGTTATDGGDEWLGIPCAAPPVGALRWASPQPHAPWTTTLEATAFGGLFKGSGAGDYSLLAATGHEVIVSTNYRLGVLGSLRSQHSESTRVTMGFRTSRRRCAGCSRTSRRSVGIRAT